MRKWKIVGYRNVSYTSKKSGRQVAGQELYLVSDPVKPDLVGVECKVIWLGSNVLFRAGSDDLDTYVHIYYDERGNVEAVIISAE